MGDKKLTVSRETYVGAHDTETLRSLQYDIYETLFDRQAGQVESCDERMIGIEASAGEDADRITALEQRKRWDTSVSASSGLVGGIIAVILFLAAKASGWFSLRIFGS